MSLRLENSPFVRSVKSAAPAFIAAKIAASISRDSQMTAWFRALNLLQTGKQTIFVKNLKS